MDIYHLFNGIEVSRDIVDVDAQYKKEDLLSIKPPP